MKKFEKEVEAELEKALNEPLQDQQKTDLSRFDKALENNKKTRPRITYFRRVAVACSLAMLIVISCLIPVWMKDDNNSSPEVVRYYGDNNTVQVSLSEEFIQNYINTNLPNYNFIFEDCEVTDITGIYDKETNKELLAFSFLADKIGTPINITVDIILNKNYTYSEHSVFTTDASLEEVNNMKIYSKEFNNLDYFYYVLLERPTYNTYLILNINDNETLNKFKQN